MVALWLPYGSPVVALWSIAAPAHLWLLHACGSCMLVVDCSPRPPHVVQWLLLLAVYPVYAAIVVAGGMFYNVFVSA